MADKKQICTECGEEGPHASIICVRNLQEKQKRGLDTRAFDILETLVEYFEESHVPEIEAGHGGDEDCSYCEALEKARGLLADWEKTRDKETDPQVIIHIEGGAVQDVYTGFSGETYTVIDCNTDGVQPPLYKGLIVEDWATKSHDDLEGDLKEALEAHDRQDPDPEEEE